MTWFKLSLYIIENTENTELDMKIQTATKLQRLQSIKELSRLQIHNQLEAQYLHESSLFRRKLLFGNDRVNISKSEDYYILYYSNEVTDRKITLTFYQDGPRYVCFIFSQKVIRKEDQEKIESEYQRVRCHDSGKSLFDWAVTEILSLIVCDEKEESTISRFLSAKSSVSC